MLDEITYSKNTDGIILKEVCHYETVDDIDFEISALQQQLECFYQGEQVPDIMLAIANYQSQIQILEGLK